jgi:hypothetical protein
VVIEAYFLATVEEIETGVLISFFLVFFFFRFSLFFGLLSPISSSCDQIKKLDTDWQGWQPSPKLVSL